MLEFSDNKIAGKVEVEHKLSEKDIETIIVNAMEGGISYWAEFRRKDNPWYKDKPEDEPLSTYMTKVILEGKEVHLRDREEEEEDDSWKFNLESLIQGFKLNYNNRAWDNNLETGDATTADCIIQYAIFGTIVYG